MRSLTRLRHITRFRALQSDVSRHSFTRPLCLTEIPRGPFSFTDSAPSTIISRSLHASGWQYAKANATEEEKACSPIFNIQDEEDFDKRVLQSQTPVIVDFHATWCRPCKLLGPRLEAHVAEEKGKVNMAKVDIDALDNLACRYNVRSVPTVLAIKNGKVVEQFIGLADDDKIKGVIGKLLH